LKLHAVKRLHAQGRRTYILAGAVTLLAVNAAPAAANHISCGATITESVTLDSNITNCKQGLRVVADNVTVDLNGYTISGRNHPGDAQYGVHLVDVTGVTVTSSKAGGTITGFDAGVGVDGGSGNTISNLIVRDNMNDLLGQAACEVGDGILINNSDDNVIEGNTVRHNGPYSGIALVGDSDGNLVSDNQVLENNVPNAKLGSGKTGPCGEPFSRPLQDIGIRIEGPGADNNIVTDNYVADSAIAGISIHGYVCNPPAGSGMAPQDPNTGNMVLNNTVTGTGSTTFPQDTLADGIAVFRQGPAAIVCTSYGNTISGNTVFGNLRDGINLNAGTHDNVVDNNLVYDNGRHGLVLANGFVSGGVTYPGAVDNTLTGNTGYGNGTNASFTAVKYDGADFNPGCDNNAWSANVFATYNQACVVAP